MDLLGYVLAGSGMQAMAPNPAADFWYQPVGSATASGLRVDTEGAQKISAWYRGRDILATSLAMLPLVVYKRLPDDKGREVAPANPVHDILHRKPNPWQDSFQWRRQAMFHIIDHGNAYSRIVPGRRGFVDELWPLHPTLVTPELLPSGRLLYHVRDPKTGQTATSTQDDIFHLRGACDDGIEGKGVLQYARDSLGLGITLENYASKLFSRGALNGGLIQVPGPVDPAAMKLAAESFKTAYNDWHMPKILPQGATWVNQTMEPDKAQFILSRKFSVNDIARWLGLPPHMLADLERSTNNNIEHQGQEFVTYSLGLWLSLWEFSINDQLMLKPETFYAEFVRDALVRGDIQTRWAAYVAGTNAGILAINEVRTKENLKKIDGGDVPREPANITGRRASDAPPSPRGPARAEETSDQALAIVQQSATRLLRKEIAAVQKCAVRHAADLDAYAAAITEFYAKHVDLVAETLQMSSDQAAAYCSQQAAQAIGEHWIGALELWGTDTYAAGLAGLALEEAA